MRILHSGALLASASALLFSAACGSSGGNASATPSGRASASGGFTAFAACMRQHGANVPTARPTARPSRGDGGGGFFGNGANRQAIQACRQLAPRGGAGGFGARGMQELQAFRSCLSDHGVTLPTPTPGARTPGAERSPGAHRTPGDGLLGRFDTGDPKVANAVKICRPLLPTFSPRPRPASS
jgi:hypothetical protein